MSEVERLVLSELEGLVLSELEGRWLAFYLDFVRTLVLATLQK
jgi:hypothetical protein